MKWQEIRQYYPQQWLLAYFPHFESWIEELNSFTAVDESRA